MGLDSGSVGSRPIFSETTGISSPPKAPLPPATVEQCLGDLGKVKGMGPDSMGNEAKGGRGKEGWALAQDSVGVGNGTGQWVRWVTPHFF